jgi:hypothetical protein
MKGRISLIKSSTAQHLRDSNGVGYLNETPIAIQFDTEPEVGSSFRFTTDNGGWVITSDVKAVDAENGNVLIQTRNSLYKLEKIS